MGNWRDVAYLAAKMINWRLVLTKTPQKAKPVVNELEEKIETLWLGFSLQGTLGLRPNRTNWLRWLGPHWFGWCGQHWPEDHWEEVIKKTWKAEAEEAESVVAAGSSSSTHWPWLQRGADILQQLYEGTHLPQQWHEGACLPSSSLGSVNIFSKQEVFGEVEDSSLIMHL